MDLPVLRVRARLGEALSEPVLRTLEGEPLVRFLQGRRWFGAKGRAPKAVRIKDVVPLFAGGVESAVARLEVDLGNEGKRIYQLPLAVRDGEPLDCAAVAAIEAEGRRGILFDAVEDPDFRDRLGRAFARGILFSGGGTRWVVAPLPQAVVPSFEDLRGRLAAAEQSNTSILYGDRAILKLYRRLEPGENPDVEIPEFLTTRGFPHVPRLFGKIQFQEDGASTTVAGMLQEFVPNRGDGWSHALDRFREEVVAAGTGSARVFRDDARRLGEITRALHEALAGDANEPDFAPVRATAEDVRLWRDRVAVQVASASDLLAERVAAHGLAAGVVPLAAKCLDQRSQLTAVLDRLAAAVADRAGARIRHHGDYHLGQVLAATRGDFVIVDFEGEPARPLVERRERRSALRDVAGMLRSFAYAAGEGVRRAETAAAGRERAGIGSRATEWEQGARSEFLTAYLRDRPGAIFLPATLRGTEALIKLFEIEKVFYELAYELDNRPDWVAIPLASIKRLLDAG